MDISDSEQSENEVEDTEPQDLFNDEADEDRLSAKEDNAKEQPIEPFQEETKVKDEKPKFRKQKNERSIITHKTLSKPSGLSALKELFKGFKFKGNGHEEEDLTRIMGILQHWMCYQLCPTYEFESCMLQLETVGKKRIVQTMMKKFRMGIEDWGEVKPNNDDQEEKDDNTEVCEPSEENDFEKFLNEEIANIDSGGELSPEYEEFDTRQKTPSEVEDLTTLEHLDTRQKTPSEVEDLTTLEHLDTRQKTPSEVEDLTTLENLDTRQKIQKEVEVSLTPEQLERIAMNKKLAEERRKKRMSQQEVFTNTEPATVNDSEIAPMQLDVDS